MALVFDCPYCGAQNFISPERLKHRERKVVCWVCHVPFSWEFLEEIMEGKPEGNKRQDMSRQGGSS